MGYHVVAARNRLSNRTPGDREVDWGLNEVERNVMHYDWEILPSWLFLFRYVPGASFVHYPEALRALQCYLADKDAALEVHAEDDEGFIVGGHAALYDCRTARRRWWWTRAEV